jgi:hypothetical protein
MLLTINGIPETRFWQLGIVEVEVVVWVLVPVELNVVLKVDVYVVETVDVPLVVPVDGKKSFVEKFAARAAPERKTEKFPESTLSRRLLSAFKVTWYSAGFTNNCTLNPFKVSLNCAHDILTPSTNGFAAITTKSIAYSWNVTNGKNCWSCTKKKTVAKGFPFPEVQLNRPVVDLVVVIVVEAEVVTEVDIVVVSVVECVEVIVVLKQG